MNMKKALTWVLILSLICGNYLPAARADDSDIFGTNIAPNVMLLLDSSQSMTDEVGTLVAYASGTTYTAVAYRGNTIVGTTVYKKLTTGSSGGLSCSTSNPCYAVYAASIAAVNSSSARTALSSVGYWSGSIGGSNLNLYYGNYLDYYFCSSCDGVEPKIDIARRVLENLVTITEGVRFGLMKFKSNGGEVVQPIRDMTAANISLLVNGVAGQNNGIKNTALTSVGTVLGEQVRDAGNYYKGTYTGQSSPIEYSCQPNFIIVISDGLWTGSVNPKTEATNRFTQDHSTTFTGLQNVLVHTIGFGLNSSNSDDATAIADLKTMAVNGGGSYFTASNSAQLEVVLQDAISQILAANFSFATPTIPSTGASGATRAYLASFQSNSSRPFWKGYFKAYSLVNGTVPTDSVTHLPSGTPIWDAGQQLSLKTASSRTIKTYASSALQDFVTTNTAITTALLGAADSTEKDQIINYIRGAVDYNDEDADTNTTEERPWKLGDIFHSTPILVAPPSASFITDSTYSTFKTANASRTALLLAGANDGMLHAFRESDGEELWAFIPPNLLDQLKNLKALTGDRDYYVDSSPIAANVKTGGAWKTIAIFGERRGGNKYYALNITDTSNPPQYLWSFSDANLGETWSEPTIGKVKMSDGTDKWVAFIGGGFDTSHSNYSGTTTTTESVFAIDLSNGQKIWEYYHVAGATDDRQYMNFSIPGAPTAVDLNNDGYIDRVYVGDVGGQLWKFDVAPTNGSTMSGSLINNWTGKRLFAAASSQANPPAAGEYYPTQAIYSRPTLAYDTNNNLWIFFGTGDRFHPNSASTNRFYGIKENTTMTNGSALAEASLTDLSGGTGSVSQGWYLIFSPANSGEKVLASAEVFAGVVLFTTFKPVTTAVCGTGGGNAKLYSVNMNTGSGAIDFSNNTLLAAGQSALTNTKDIGTGIPSKPVIVLAAGSGPAGAQADPTLTAVGSNTSGEVWSGGGLIKPQRTLVGWREVFQ